MAITVVTPPQDTKLTTLAKVKTRLGITTSTDDAMIEDIIDEVSDQIKTYTNRIFPKQTVTETFPTDQQFDLVLSITPIVSVTSITFDSETVDSADYELADANAGIIFKESGWTTSNRGYFGMTRYPMQNSFQNLVEVTYEGGYVLPSFTTGTRDLPYDIENAAIELVKSSYLTRQNDPSVAQIDIPDVANIKYGGSDTLGASGLPIVAEQLLSKWVRAII